MPETLLCVKPAENERRKPSSENSGDKSLDNAAATTTTTTPRSVIIVPRSKSQATCRRVTPASIPDGGPGVIEKRLPNGDLYIGTFSSNTPHGSGKYLWKDGCMYEGDWKKGKASGRGKFSWPSGATFEGEFKSGRMEITPSFSLYVLLRAHVFSLLGFQHALSMAQEAQAVSGAENGAKASQVVFTAAKPWLVVEAPKANDAVQFYKAAFGAEELSRVNDPKRKAEQELPLIRSAELKIGSSVFVVSDLTDDSSSPLKSAVSGLVFCLETEAVEAAIAKAVAAGAVSEDEVAEGEGACCGGRVGKVKDPYGNVWLICSPAKKCGDVAA